MNDQFISIAMATYNGALFVEEQIRSVLEQTITNFELIITDDASNDETPLILQQLATEDSRIKLLLHTQNKGVNNNFEIALKACTGDFIAIADQDDIWLPNKLEASLKLFADQNIVLVYGRSAVFSGDKPKEIPALKPIKLMEGSNPRKLALRNSISGHNIVFRRSLLDNALPLPSSILYDWWFGEIATCVGNIAAANEVLVYQRQHASNFTLYNRSTWRQSRREYEERKNALEAFQAIRPMSSSDKMFFHDLLQKWTKTENNKFNWCLFLFLLSNAGTLFFYKKKLLPYFSYLKAAYKLSSITND